MRFTSEAARQVRQDMSDAIRDGALDPEFVLHINEHLAPGDSYRRQVNTAALMYSVLGDEFIRNLGLDPNNLPL